MRLLVLAALLLLPVAVAATGPLTIQVSSPADQARVDVETVALAGLVSADGGVAGVVVLLNQAEVARLGDAAPTPALALSLPLTLRDGRNLLVVRATDAGGRIAEVRRTIHYERRVPLGLEILSPLDQAALAARAVTLSAVARSSRLIARTQIAVNGAVVHDRPVDPPKPVIELSVPLELREGANVVVVTAAEPDGTDAQEVRTVMVAVPPPAVVTPPAPRSERWAVVIGVGRYDHRAVPRLAYPAADADALERLLVERGGFRRDHVVLMTDQTERKPTLRNIKWALGTFLARAAKKEDTVLVFFAGHGAPEVDPRGREADGLTKYLVPSDADPEDLYATAFPMDEIENVFARIEAGRIVAFFDTCYSGAAGGRTFAPTRTRVGAVDEAFLDRLATTKGRAVITASRPSEVSLELPELGHGLFSYYLLEGLRGAADLDRDGVVTVQELYQYLERQVAQKSRAVGGNQHPTMRGQLEGPFPLAGVTR